MYKPKYLACTTSTNFADLIQRAGESVDNYHLRVQQSYKRLYDSKLDTMGVVRAITAAADVKKEGMTNMAKLFTHQLFLDSPCDHL